MAVHYNYNGIKHFFCLMLAENEKWKLLNLLECNGIAFEKNKLKVLYISLQQN